MLSSGLLRPLLSSENPELWPFGDILICTVLRKVSNSFLWLKFNGVFPFDSGGLNRKN